MLTDEFYEIFKNVDRSKIDELVESLSIKRKNNLIRVFVQGTHKVDTNLFKKTIDILKKKVYKKDLREKLGVYDKEKLKNILDNLTKKEKMTLLKEYSYTDNELKEQLSKSEITRNSKTINKILMNSNKRNNYHHEFVEYKPYYEVFKNYTKEEVDTIFQFNTEREKELIYKKYGKDFSNIKFNYELTSSESMEIASRILLNMRRRMDRVRNKEAIITNISSIFNENSETLLKRSSLLLNADKRKLTKLFGKDFTKTALINKKYFDRLFTLEMKEILNGNKNTKKKIYKIRPLENYLIKAKKENETIYAFKKRIASSLEILTIEEKNMMYKKYGSDLSITTNEIDMTEEEKYTIIHSILPKIERYLKKEAGIIKTHENKTLFQRLEFENTQTILRNIKKLKEKDILLLKKKYGVEFSYPGKMLDYKESNRCESVIKKLRNLILEETRQETKIDIEKLKIIKKLYKTEVFSYLNSIYGCGVALGVILMLKYPDMLNEEEFYCLTGAIKKDIKSLISINIDGYSKGIQEAYTYIKKI